MRTRGDRLRTWAVGVWAVLSLVYLFVPIAIVALYSFNDPKGRFNFTWQGFTLDHWKHPFAVEGLREALTNSLVIGALATVIAVALCTLMFIYGAARQGVPPQVNVLATALLLVVLGLTVLNVVLQRHLARRDAPALRASPAPA